MMLMYADSVPPVLVAVIVKLVVVINSVGVPLMTPVAVSNARPAGRLGLMDQVTNSPDPVKVGEIGRPLAVLLVNVKSLGTYSKVGTWSTIVMLMYAVADPPEFVPVIVNIVRVRSSVGVPVISPVPASRARPDGRLGLTVQDTIVPAPVMVGESGRSLLAVLLVIDKSFGKYSIVGTTSFTRNEIVVELLPPALLAVMV